MNKIFSKIANDKNLLIASYFTLGTKYEEFNESLVNSLDKFNLNYYIEGVPNKGSWKDNDNIKPYFVLDILKKNSGKKILFVDIDSSFFSKLIFIEKITCDIAINISKNYYNKTYVNTSSFVLTSNDKTIKLIKNWIKKFEENKNILSRDSFYEVIEKHPKENNLKIFNLPPSYCYDYFETSKKFNNIIPVIVNKKASRELKNQIRFTNKVVSFDKNKFNDYIFFIPARKGSKGVKDKNLILFDKTIQSLPLHILNNVVISTNDDIIIEKAKLKNIKFYKRSENLSDDFASMKDVLLDYCYLHNINKKKIVLLYLTYPERTMDDIKNAINFFEQNNTKSLLCKKEPKTNPYLCMYKNGLNGKQIIKHDLYRRQDYPEIFEISHFIGIFNTEEIKKLNKNLYNNHTIFYKIEDKIDIDNVSDLKKFNNKKHISNKFVSLNNNNQENKKIENKKDIEISKYAICTVTNDPFIIGTKIMLYSLLKQNPWFNGDFVVLKSKNISKINKENEKDLLKIYKKTKFIDVDESLYQKVFDKFKNVNSMHQRMMPSIFTFEAFALEKYDRVVFLDSDTIVTGDVKRIFYNPFELAVTPDNQNRYSNEIELDIKQNKIFNGGFLSIAGSMLNKNVRDDLIKFSENFSNIRLITHFDQSFMNFYFADKKIAFLSNKYNTLKRALDDNRFKKIEDTRIIHYVGEKPWNEKQKTWEKRYTKVEKIWQDCYNEYKNKKNSRLAVFVHIFYSDLWSEIKKNLKNIDEDFDLYISITDDENRDVLLNDIRKEYKKCYIKMIKNVGSDIGGFIELINFAISENKSYDYILKIHTKKSELTAKSLIGKKIRSELFSSLFGTKENVKKILSIFEKNKDIGIIGPKKYLMGLSSNDRKNRFEINRENMNILSKKLGIKNNKLEFYSGSMFWIRWEVIEEFLNNKLTILDFNEKHQADGTMAHAMERLFTNMVKDLNLKLFSV